MKKIIIANWKMNLDLSKSMSLAVKYKKFGRKTEHELVICPSEFALKKVGEIISGHSIKLGAQNVFWQEDGSYTGEVSARSLEKLGCKYVLVGHSERRQNLNETDEMVNAKVLALLKTKLIPVICVGETLAEKKAKKGKAVLARQIRKALEDVKLGKQQLIIAYEPIWAIGTGQAIKPDQADEQHYYIYSLLERVFGKKKAQKNCRVIYGGSVDAHNGSKLLDLKYVDGLLIGGASLDFKKIAKIK
ncbi:MAG: triose-phosphate isomerase [bacterium]